MLLPIQDIIKKSWELYVKNFKKLLPYILISLIPNVVVSVTGIISLKLDDYAKTDAFMSVNNLIVLAITVAGMIFSLWISIALNKSLREAIFGREIIPVKNGLNISSHLIWPVFYTSLLSFIIIFGGMVLFIIPGIIFAIWYAFVYYAVIFEEKTGRGALKLSKELVKTRWWAIFGRLLGVGLFFGIIILIITNIFADGFSLIANEQIDKDLISGIITVLINAITIPLTSLAGIIIYLNAKENPVLQPEKTLGIDEVKN